MSFEPKRDGLIAAIVEVLHIIRQQKCLPEVIHNLTTMSTGLVSNEGIRGKRAVPQHENTKSLGRGAQRMGQYWSLSARWASGWRVVPE